VTPTACDKIKRTNGAHRDWSELCHQLRELGASLHVDGPAPVRAKIKEIVPEYRSTHALSDWAPVSGDKTRQKAAGND